MAQQTLDRIYPNLFPANTSRKDSDKNNKVILIKCAKETLASEELIKRFAQNCAVLYFENAYVVVVIENNPEKTDFDEYIASERLIENVTNSGGRAIGIDAVSSGLLKKSMSEGFFINSEILFCLEKSGLITFVRNSFGKGSGATEQLNENMLLANIALILNPDVVVFQHENEISMPLSEFLSSENKVIQASYDLLEALEFCYDQMQTNSKLCVLDYKKPEDIAEEIIYSEA